jgi:hypothetical protein
MSGQPVSLTVSLSFCGVECCRFLCNNWHSASIMDLLTLPNGLCFSENVISYLTSFLRLCCCYWYFVWQSYQMGVLYYKYFPKFVTFGQSKLITNI